MKSIASPLQNQLNRLRLQADQVLAPRQAASLGIDVVDELMPVLGQLRAREARGLSDAHVPRGQSRGSWLQIEMPQPATSHVAPVGAARRAGPQARNMLELCDAAKPMVLVGDRGAAGSPMRKSQDPVTLGIIALYDAAWSPAAFQKLHEHRGNMVFSQVCACLTVQIVCLRLEAVLRATGDGGALAQALLHRLEHVLPHMAHDMRQFQASTLTDRYFATPAAHAARALDLEGLRLILNQAGDGGKTFAALMLYLVVALESRYWPQLPVQGAATVAYLFDEICQSSADGPWWQAQEARDAAVRAVLSAQRLEALPMVVRAYQEARARCLEPECPYLIWAIKDGFSAGVTYLLEHGLSPNDRSPGESFGHTRFSVGATPLLAALTSERLSDGRSVAVARTLLQHGAHLYAAFHNVVDGQTRSDPFDIQQALERSGLSRRWHMLTQLEPQDQPKRVDTALMNAALILQKFITLAQGIKSGGAQNAALDVLDAAERAHHLVHADFQASANYSFSLMQFISHTGMLFADVGRRPRPYTQIEQPFAGANIPCAFYGSSFTRNPATLMAREQSWADEALAAAEKLEKDLFGAPPSERGTPSAWLEDLANFIRPHGTQRAEAIQIALLILRGELQEALKLLDVAIYNTPKERSLGFIMAVSELGRSPEEGAKATLQAIARTIVEQCTDVPTACALVEMALRVGAQAWLKDLLIQVLEHRMDLVKATSCARDQENLLHIAAESPLKMLKVLCSTLPVQWRLCWLKQADEHGDTPLHKAARIGIHQVKALVSGLDAQQVRAIATLTNISERNAALEGLVASQPAVFVHLSRLGEKLTSGAALARALLSRRGVLTPDLMQSLLSNPHSAALLRSHAAALGRKLARLGDQESLSTLIGAFKSEVLVAAPGSKTMLHIIAEVDGAQTLALLRAHASQDQLRVLAEQPDAQGLRAEHYTNDLELRRALSVLRGRTQTPSPVRAPSPRAVGWGRLRVLVNAVAKATRTEALERSVSAFLARVEHDLAEAAVNDDGHARLNALAWEVIDHIDRAPVEIGVRLGVHLNLHRPENSLTALQERAATTRSGASRFSALGGLALLRGRSAAIAQARAMALRPGMQTVVQVAAPDLGGSGYKNSGTGPVYFDNGAMLRTVFAQTSHGLLLVTAYAA